MDVYLSNPLLFYSFRLKSAADQIEISAAEILTFWILDQTFVKRFNVGRDQGQDEPTLRCHQNEGFDASWRSSAVLELVSIDSPSWRSYELDRHSINCEPCPTSVSLLSGISELVGWLIPKAFPITFQSRPRIASLILR